MPTGAADVTNMKANWVPDKEAIACLACEKSFNSFRRKHHCRLCGQVFCNSCSQQKTTKGKGGEILAKPQRACMACYTEVNTMQSTGFRTSISRPGSLPSPPADDEDDDSSGSESDDSSLSAGEQLEGYAERFTGGTTPGTTAVWPGPEPGSPQCTPATHSLLIKGVGQVALPIVPLPAPEVTALDASLDVQSRVGVCPLALSSCGVRFGATVGKALAKQLLPVSPEALLSISAGGGSCLAIETCRALGIDAYALAQKAEAGLEQHQQVGDMLCASYNVGDANRTLQLDKRSGLHGKSLAVVLDSISDGELVKALLRLAREAGATVVAIGVVIEVDGGWREVLGATDAALLHSLGSVPVFSIASDGTATAVGAAAPEPEPESVAAANLRNSISV